LAGANTPIMNTILEWRMSLVKLRKMRRCIPVSTVAARYKTIELLASSLD
jgi:hypothetical protein